VQIALNAIKSGAVLGAQAQWGSFALLAALQAVSPAGLGALTKCCHQ
jgi:hypothetical protein